jgi:hypothetical protein
VPRPQVCKWWGWRCSLEGEDKLCLELFHQAFDHLKHVMRTKFRHSRWRPERYIFADDQYNVAWHIRTGDISLHRGEAFFFKRVFEQVGRLSLTFTNRAISSCAWLYLVWSESMRPEVIC